jgi:hypothetical protein
MIAEIEHLKAVIEGKPDLPSWRQWFEEHKLALAGIFTRGQLLRLRHHPMTEIPKILQEQQVSFVSSDVYEWIDDDSKSGRCRYCGAFLQTERWGDTWILCPNGCVEAEFHTPPQL